MLTELLQNWMNSKRCYVTGASGALGSEISIALHSLTDLEVVPLRRNENNTYIPNLQLRNQDGNRDPKFLVHCGWDTGNRTLAAQSNSKTETLEIAQYCQEHEIKMIFISSQSAILGTQSNYGAMKFEAEKIVAEHDGTSVRPGLILFNPPAGIQKKLYAFSFYGIRIKFYPNVKISVIAVRDITKYLTSIIGEDIPIGSTATLRNESMPLNALTDLSQRRFGVVIPIPLKLLHAVVRLVGLMRGRVLAIEDSLSAISF